MPLPGHQHRETPASANPFVPTVPHMSEWTAQEIATLSSRLDKQLGPEYISTRPGAGGGKVHYLAAEKVINLANEVFGFNGWSSGIQNVQIDFVDENTQNGKITLGLSTIVRVTLRDGTFHEDIGYGHIENCKGKAAAFEKAKKEAATDALKRALRNFGNVLGNCLYDKDYLQKVTKVKVAPSRWDEVNLHRHPDYAPIKREAIAGTEKDGQTNKSNVGAPSGPQRLTSAQSLGSGEGEDDFGGNFFDDTDFSHTDDVRIDDSADPLAQRHVDSQRQAAPRMTSMPQLRPPNLQTPLPPQRMNVPQKPSEIQRPSNSSVGSPQRPMPSPQILANQTAHTTPTALAGDSKIEGSRPVLPQNPPLDAPIGFVTGRAAGALNQTGEPKTLNPSLAFNPHAESPSIRRTQGINLGKSAPISRKAIEAISNGAVSGGQGPANDGPPFQQSLGNGSNGFAAPSRTNFVNPSADLNRRIGMPNGPGPMSNRGGYKPPTAVKRSALTDVSNLQQTDGTSDAKKAKLEPLPPEEAVKDTANGAHDLMT